MTNTERYDKVFMDVFEISGEELAGLKYQDIEAWDSVGHMNLIAAIVRTVYLRHLINLDLSFYFKDVLLRVIIVSLTSIIIPILLYLHVGSGWWQLIFITTLFLIILGASIIVFGLNSFERDLLKKTVRQKLNI